MVMEEVLLANRWASKFYDHEALKLSCHAKTAKKPADKTSLDER